MYCFLLKRRKPLTERLRITSHKYWVRNWLGVSELLIVCVSSNWFCSTSPTNPHTTTILSTIEQCRTMLQRYNTMQHNTTKHSTIHAIQLNTIQQNTVQYNAIQCNTIQYNITQRNTIQFNTIQYSTIQHNTIQHNTTQYNTTQHNTIQHWCTCCTANWFWINYFRYYFLHVSTTLYQLQNCTWSAEQQATETLLSSWQSLSWSTNATRSVPVSNLSQRCHSLHCCRCCFRYFAFMSKS